MTEDAYRIRRMTKEEVALAADWAAGEGWNPGLNDAGCFHAADPDGFLLGELDGEPVACISGVRYGDAFGFLGFYIVKPEHRGRGFGYRIWKACMEHLGSRNIGLDGVVEQQPNYRKSGFAFAYNNIRYEGMGETADIPEAVDLAELPYEQVGAYDRRCFPAQRDAFLTGWLKMPDSAALGLRKEGELRGYGVIRRCRHGHKIGPLFADDPETGETLYRALTSKAAGEPVFLDIPDVNPEAKALVERYGMNPVFETARMYTGPQPEIDLDRIYGVTTFELG